MRDRLFRLYMCSIHTQFMENRTHFHLIEGHLFGWCKFLTVIYMTVATIDLNCNWSTQQLSCDV